MQIGLPGLVFIVFLVLKLTGYIAWSWWWVTSPLWISFAIGLIFLALFLGFGATLGGLLSRSGRRSSRNKHTYH